MVLTRSQVEEARRRAVEMLKRAGIVITEEERRNMEVTDFGLGDLYTFGLQIIVYVNNERYCAKELILFPRQICPEHKHPPFNNYPGKQETFRCRWGEVYLYVPGPPTEKPRAIIPRRKEYFTVWHEVVLRPGEQYTIPPNTLHWFQAGDEGAIVSEFSSWSVDEKDVFTDPGVKRIAVIIED